MTPWMRKMHKWLGLLVALQLVLWMTSGLMMSLLDHDKVQGHTFRAHAHPDRPWPQGLLSSTKIVAASPTPVHSVSAKWLLLPCESKRAGSSHPGAPKTRSALAA